MKNSIKNWFSFSKKERLGIISLIAIMAIFLLLPSMFKPKLPPILVDSVYHDIMGKHVPIKPDSGGINNDFEKVTFKPSLFYFDPNILSEKGWVQLGLKQKTVHTLLNYLNKGGRFKTPEDLKKIWGMLPEEADRLIPFVQIKQIQVKQKMIIFKAIQLKKIIDINEATLSDWESFPGIGPVLANRIIHYRDKLGGFNSIEQLKKTYGITDSVFQLILPNLTIKEFVNERSKKGDLDIVDINRADEASLIKSGIPESIAKAIVLYRKQYGKYQQMSDLKKIVFINEAVFQQISPKLKLE